MQRKNIMVFAELKCSIQFGLYQIQREKFEDIFAWIFVPNSEKLDDSRYGSSKGPK